ncbi:MAG: DUF192 domain-containing protein [Okeania sp. SIO3C4]|nr:DUF192 domain-containing protein [Okeania sp. SIO3C4]
MKRLTAFALCFFAFSTSVAVGQVLRPEVCDTLAPLDPMPQGVARLVTDDGNVREFSVEFAITPATWQRGLMCREEMAADAGMLFLFPDVRPHSFWMRNTLISLDIIYIGQDCRVLNVAANAVPLDETSLPSKGPARAVLEINGGLSSLLSIEPGSLLQVPGIPIELCGVPD